MTEEYQDLLIRGLTKFKEWEFSTVPNENEIDHIFSDKYLKVKEKLLNKLGQSYWKYVNTVAKKAAIIILTIIIAFSSLMTVDSIRETIIDFVVNIYNTFAQIEANHINSPATIETFYSIPFTPKAFYKKYLNCNKLLSSICWRNNQSENIILTQASPSRSYKFNSEHGELREFIINDTPCLTCKDNNLYYCYWEYDGYRFELIYPIDLGEEFMSEVVGKLVEIDPEDINN